MLNHLRGKNLGVLEDAAIAPAEGFTVITGETGAGKTLLLGALRLLAGGRPNTNAVGPKADELTAEGLFVDGGAELGVTRIVPRDGRSRAYLDGAIVSAETLEQRLGGLIEIVGQHDQMRLRQPQADIGFLDGALDPDCLVIREQYARAWIAYREAQDDQKRLGGDTMALERELDLVRYQAREITEAGLSAGDDAEMERLATRLRNAGLIRESLSLALSELETASDSLGLAVSALRKAESAEADLGEAHVMAQTSADVTHDLIREIRDAAHEPEDAPARLEEIETRLTRLGELKRKYGKTLDEVLEFGAEAGRRADELDDLLSRAAHIDELLRQRHDGVVEAGRELSEARVRAAARVEGETKAHLQTLGLERATLRIEVEPVDPGPTGSDRASLLFASDPGLEPGPIANVASGGELSRLVLALRLATRPKDIDTLVFDEVDAGVGGATALALGEKLAELAKTAQVLCVTHLPQVAARADRHFVIDRVGATATVTRVEGDERLKELSRMLSGLPDSAAGRDTAAELLQGAGT
ncbi:MAG: AAA family ATPase [Acidimicrobiia bacterium]